MFKDIKWGNKELPGLSHDTLNKLTHKNLVATDNLLNGMTTESASKNGKAGGFAAKELGVGIHTNDTELKNKWAAMGGSSNSSESQSNKNKKRKVNGHKPPTAVIAYFYDKQNGLGEYVGEYNSISECSRLLHLDKGNMHKVLIRKQKQHKGYYFEYKK